MIYTQVNSFNRHFTIMYKKILNIAFAFITFTGTACAAEQTYTLGAEAPKQIFVNNRILANVNGKPISVIDIMKKMDMQFYRAYPQYTDNAVARFQYYELSWKHVLKELIDKELIIADATENKLPVTSGDVRQEMETMFGPNIILNLDKVGLTFDEAWQMVQDDITLKRMLYVRVQSKAFKKITPKDVRDAYDDFAKNNLRLDEWHYNVITIRNPDPVRGAETAQFAYQLLAEQKIPLDELNKQITTFANWSSKTKLTVSEEFNHKEKDLADNYKEYITKLSSGTFSQPVAMQSRADKTSVFRLFYMKEFVPGGVIPYNEVEAKLKAKLVEDYIETESTAYLKKLRRTNNVQEYSITELSKEFLPFVLK